MSVNNGFDVVSGIVDGDMQCEFLGRCRLVDVVTPIGAGKHEIRRRDNAAHRTTAIDQNVAVVETHTEMAVEVDDPEAHQDGNAVRQSDTRVIAWAGA